MKDINTSAGNLNEVLTGLLYCCIWKS